MDTNLLIEEAIKNIKNGENNCIAIKNGNVVYSDVSKGIKPILKLYESGLLEGCFVVDKIIGKAAALIIVLGKASGCYGEIMSDGGIAVLEKNNISFSFGEKCEAIINRLGTDICPMEKTVIGIDDPAEAYKALSKKVKELSKD